MQNNNLPEEMKLLKQWVCFRYFTDRKTGEKKKILISPKNNTLAKCNDPQTWTSFEDADNYCRRFHYTGLAFALNGGITCVDLDHSVDENGCVTSKAKAVLEDFKNTYTELSISGQGIHIFVRGELPDNALKRKDNIEMYSRKRFICMTGNSLNGIMELADYTNEIENLNVKYIGKRRAPVVIETSGWQPSDDEVIEKIALSRLGGVFDDLYSGKIASDSDRSKADYYLIRLIAWWTQDVNQIDRIFRSSALYRPKWDEMHGPATYGQMTIQSAIRNLSSTYQPKKSYDKEPQR